MENRNLPTEMGLLSTVARALDANFVKRHLDVLIPKCGRSTKIIKIDRTLQEPEQPSYPWACNEPLVRRDSFVAFQVDISHCWSVLCIQVVFLMVFLGWILCYAML